MSEGDMLKPSGEYYWDGGLVTLAVKGRLFRVPQHRFSQQSEVFRELFRLPQEKSTVNCGEGAGDQNPIHLPVPDDVTADGFEAFLRELYPHHSSPSKSESRGLEEWKAIMKLSSLWFFDDIRNAAISQLDRWLQGEQAAAQAVLLGRAYQIKSWLVKGYLALTNREGSITNEEVGLLGWETAADIFRLREQALRGASEKFEQCQYGCDNHKVKLQYYCEWDGLVELDGLGAWACVSENQISELLDKELESM